jgi:hypothetical protein
MAIFDLIPGVKTSAKVRSRYDKLWERTAMEMNEKKRAELLRLLENAAPPLARLEQHYLSGYEKRHLIASADMHLDRAEQILKDNKFFQSLSSGKNKN